MKKNAIVLFNRQSKSNQAGKLSNFLKSILKNIQYRLIELDEETVTKISVAIKSGERFFIAAGGDGTVHTLLNLLIKHKGETPLNHFTLGAIGFGSSNDFHKPLSSSFLDIPIRLDHKGVSEWDIVETKLYSSNQLPQTIYFIVSGSVGLVADANAIFNKKSGIIHLLKKVSTPSAILYSALKGIITHHPLNLESPTNALCFLKTPHLSGTLRINKDISHHDGLISLVSIKNSRKLKLIKILNDLGNNRFIENKNLQFEKKSEFIFQLPREVNVELDGEIYQASKIELKIHNEKIKVLGNEKLLE